MIFFIACLDNTCGKQIYMQQGFPNYLFFVIFFENLSILEIYTVHTISFDKNLLQNIISEIRDSQIRLQTSVSTQIDESPNDSLKYQFLSFLENCLESIKTIYPRNNIKKERNFFFQIFHKILIMLTFKKSYMSIMKN